MKSKIAYILFFSLFMSSSPMLHAHFHFGPGMHAPHAPHEGGEEIHEDDDHFHFGPGM